MTNSRDKDLMGQFDNFNPNDPFQGTTDTSLPNPGGLPPDPSLDEMELPVPERRGPGYFFVIFFALLFGAGAGIVPFYLVPLVTHNPPVLENKHDESISRLEKQMAALSATVVKADKSFSTALSAGDERAEKFETELKRLRMSLDALSEQVNGSPSAPGAGVIPNTDNTLEGLRRRGHLSLFDRQKYLAASIDEKSFQSGYQMAMYAVHDVLNSDSSLHRNLEYEYVDVKDISRDNPSVFPSLGEDKKKNGIRVESDRNARRTMMIIVHYSETRYYSLDKTWMIRSDTQLVKNLKRRIPPILEIFDVLGDVNVKVMVVVDFEDGTLVSHVREIVLPDK